MENDNILDSKWLRVSWNSVVAFGVGIDLNQLILGVYVGPVSVYIGNRDNLSDEEDL